MHKYQIHQIGKYIVLVRINLVANDNCDDCKHLFQVSTFFIIVLFFLTSVFLEFSEIPICVVLSNIYTVLHVIFCLNGDLKLHSLGSSMKGRSLLLV